MPSTLFNVAPVPPETEEFDGDDLDVGTEDLPLPEIVHKPDYKSKDMTLYNAWKDSQAPKDMANLIEHLHPIIFSQVHQQAGSVPQSALAGTGRIWAKKAIESYDPSKGAALSTHVANYIRKIRRQNYKFRGPVRLSENKQRDFTPYKRALENLTEELMREPNPDEMAERLGWSKGAVVKFSKLYYTDVPESSVENASQYETFSDKNLLMEELISRFTPEEKIIFENKGKVPAPKLAAMLGVDTNRLNYLQRKLINKIMDIRKEIGL